MTQVFNLKTTSSLPAALQQLTKSNCNYSSSSIPPHGASCNTPTLNPCPATQQPNFASLATFQTRNNSSKPNSQIHKFHLML